MSKQDDPGLVRAALIQRLKVHTRVAQQGLGPTPDQRKKLAASLPDILAFGDRRYAAAHVVLDWDHRLPSNATLLRLYLSYTDREAADVENTLKARDREIDASNLYPEFDVPDYGDVDASETYVGLVRPGGLEVEELRFFSDWRKSVQQPVVRDVLAAVRSHAGYERSMRERTSRKDRVGVVERDATGLGEHQLLAATLEECVAELLLELPNLHGDRRLRHVQPLCRAGQVGLMRDRPEVVEVVEVEHAHRSIPPNDMFN